jgi:hypothetical protein
MSWTSIPHAHEYWQTNRRLAEPPDNLEDVEIFVLSAPPNTAKDAMYILDVVCAYGGDARCDDLDHAALGRVRTFLSTTA